MHFGILKVFWYFGPLQIQNENANILHKESAPSPPPPAPSAAARARPPPANFQKQLEKMQNGRGKLQLRIVELGKEIEEIKNK